MKNEELHRLVVQTSASYVYAQCIEQTHRAYPSSIKHATNVLSVAPPRSRMHEWDARLHAGTSPACTISLLDYIYIHTPHIIMWLGRKSNAKLPGNIEWMKWLRASLCVWCVFAYLAQRASVWHPCPIYPVTYYTNPLSARTLNNICRQ